MSFDPSQTTIRLLSRGDQNGDNALFLSEFIDLDGTSSFNSTTSSISPERMTALFEAIDSDGSLSGSEEGGMDMLKSMTAAASYQLTGASELPSISSANLTLA